MNKHGRNGNDKPKSICWDCENATNANSCSWTESFEPVRGWSAKNTLIGRAGAQTESYCVLECPKFKRNSYNYGIDRADIMCGGSKKLRLFDDDVVRLAEAIIEQAVEDWKALLFGDLTETYFCNEKIKRDKTLEFFFSKDFEILLSTFSDRLPEQIRSWIRITDDIRPEKEASA